MPEYIERKAALAEIDKAFKLFEEHGDIIRLFSDVQGAVIYAPAPEVAPVRHGRWEIDEFGCFCSACREYAEEVETGEDRQLVPMRSPFCPNCSAKMDGDSNASI